MRGHTWKDNVTMYLKQGMRMNVEFIGELLKFRIIKAGEFIA